MTGIQWGTIAAALLLPLSAESQSARPGEKEVDRLPVRRVVLYKNGVGYFEHIGKVRDKQDVRITFTSGQLDDVLKSLTVLDLDGGRITGVAYNSRAPVDRQLGDLRLPSGQTRSLAEFLSGLRGARIEVRLDNQARTGRLLGVERRTRLEPGGRTIEIDCLSLLTDQGEMQLLELTRQFSVRLLDKELAGKVDRLLDVLSLEREADTRQMVLSTDGRGERSLFVSYISEVPVWKATYRIVLGAGAGAGATRKPLLQGWAIVDNTVGQDWENVALSLVAGAPQSFVQNLSQPLYLRRPVVPVAGSLNEAPQTYQSTLAPGTASVTGTVQDPSGAVIPGAVVKAYNAGGALVGEARANDAGVYELANLADGQVRLDIQSPGFQRYVKYENVASAAGATRSDATLQIGSTAEAMGITTAAAYPLQTSESSVSVSARSLGSGRALGTGGSAGKGTGSGRGGGVGSGSGGGFGGGAYRIAPQAEAQVLGDLFEYKLKEPITIRKNSSALVPVLEAPVEVEKVSIWNDQAGSNRPRRALWLTNSSGATLDGGSFSVLEEEAFAGEGIFEPIRVGERRLISYAADLAVTASSKSENAPQRMTRVRVSHGVMIQDSQLRETRTYAFRNADSTARTIIVEHPVRAGYALASQIKPVETTAAWMRFRLEVPPGQTASLAVEEVRPGKATYQISDLDSDTCAIFVRQGAIDPPLEAALRRVLAQKDAIADLDAKQKAWEDQKDEIYNDQQRLRENIKSLRGSAEEKALLQRYTQRLNEQETKLDELHRQIEQVKAQSEAAQAALDKLIQEMSFDTKLGG